jgi:hypothetical protein
MTKEQHEEILKKIVESSDSETTMTLIQSLRTDFDDMAQKNTASMSDLQTKAREWQDKYLSTRQQYIDRFFGNANDTTSGTNDNTDTTTKPKTFEQLFKNKEDK